MTQDRQDDDATVIVGRTVSIAVIKTKYGEFIGEAKRAPGDQWNFAVGYNLAYGRALRQYGVFLENAGQQRSDALCAHRP